MVATASIEVAVEPVLQETASRTKNAHGGEGGNDGWNLRIAAKCAERLAHEDHDDRVAAHEDGRQQEPRQAAAQQTLDAVEVVPLDGKGGGDRDD